jgi:hypothetical protein
LRPALKEKKWASIAAGYNGPGYRRNNYDSQLESIYEKLVKRRKATSSNVGKNLK